MGGDEEQHATEHKDSQAIFDFFPERRFARNQASMARDSKQRQSLVLDTHEVGRPYADQAHTRPTTSMSNSTAWNNDDGGIAGLSSGMIKRDRRSGLPEPQRRPARRSFSGFGGALDGIRTLPERVASLRQKRFFTSRKLASPEENKEQHSSASDDVIEPKTSGWLRRAASTILPYEQRSSGITRSDSQEASPQTFSVSAALPIISVEPPRFLYNPSSGAAARAAAAAASGEMFGSVYSIAVRSETGLVEPKVNTDSESGIGIDIRDQSEEVTENTDNMPPIVRKGSSTLVVISS